jgi:hypothetical protein
VVVAGERVSAQCMLVAPDPVARLAADRVPSMDTAIRGWETRGRTNLQEDDLGRPSSQIRTERRSLAGLVGWKDARIVSLVGRFDGIVATWEQQLTAGLTATAETLGTGSVRLGEVSLGVGGLSCGPRTHGGSGTTSRWSRGGQSAHQGDAHIRSSSSPIPMRSRR